MATDTLTMSTRRRDFLSATGFVALTSIAGAAIARPHIQKSTSPALIPTLDEADSPRGSHLA